MNSLRLISIFFSLLIAGVTTAQNTHFDEATSSTTPTQSNYQFDLTHDTESWHTGFANYALGTEFAAQHHAELQSVFMLDDGFVMTGLKLQSINLSAETTMFAQTKIDDLPPSTTFSVAVHLTFATNVSDQCIGIGAAPHEVSLKASITPEKPTLYIDDQDFMRTTIDLGHHQETGVGSLFLGNIGSRLIDNCDPSSLVFHEKTIASQPRYLIVTSDENGELWITLSAESGFAGITTIYLLDAEITLSTPETRNDLT